jgi:hypothetical protein
MRFRTAWLVIVAAVGCRPEIPPDGPAPQPAPPDPNLVTLASKEPKPGDRLAIAVEIRDRTATRFTNYSDPTRGEQVQVGGQKLSFVEEVLAKPADRDGVLTRRTYESAEWTRDGKPTDLGLAGKTVEFRPHPRRREVQASVVGGELPAAAADFFRQELAARPRRLSGAEVLPDRPVRVGEDWPVDAARMTGELAPLNLTPAEDQPTGLKGRLTKVYDRGGRRYGVVDVTGAIAVGKVHTDNTLAGSELKFEFRYDGCVDGSEVAGEARSRLTGTVTMVTSFYTVTVDRTATVSIREAPPR